MTTPKNQDKALAEGGDKSAVKQAAQAESLRGPSTEGSSNAPTSGKIIRRNAPSDGDQTPLREAPKPVQMMVVEEDTYEEFYTADAKRPLYRLVYPRNSVVSVEEYERLTSDNPNAAVGVGDVTQMVNGAEARVGGTVERGK